MGGWLKEVPSELRQMPPARQQPLRVVPVPMDRSLELLRVVVALEDRCLELLSAALVLEDMIF